MRCAPRRFTLLQPRDMYLHNFKTRSVFLIGFAIGFILVLALLVTPNVFSCVSNYQPASSPCSSSTYRSSLLRWITSDEDAVNRTRFQPWRASNSSYEKLLRANSLKLRDTDMDAYLYGPENETEMEAEWLKSHVHVTCVVFAKKIKLAKAIKDTWGKRCNRIYFFGRAEDAELPVISFRTKLVSSWQQLCEAFNYVWRDSEEKAASLEWLIFVKDDTIVIPENLRYMLGPLNHTEDHYLGHAVVLWGQAYNVAEAGYVVSVGALQKLIKKFDNSEKCVAGGKYWKQEDYYLAKHLASMGIFPADTRDQYSRATFLGYPLQSLLWGVAKVSDYWKRALYPVKNECCSFTSVTFNVGEAYKMYTFNYLLYHFHVLKKEAVFGKEKAATAVPDEDVWKVALKEEFNLTHLHYISSESYYEIWFRHLQKQGIYL